ncbi:MAG: hypothetical protein V2A79_10115 [Planctomycetota bacterium]
MDIDIDSDGPNGNDTDIDDETNDLVSVSAATPATVSSFLTYNDVELPTPYGTCLFPNVKGFALWDVPNELIDKLIEEGRICERLGGHAWAQDRLGGTCHIYHCTVCQDWFDVVADKGN